MLEPTPTALTFEQALEQLEKVVRQLEDGQTGLEDSLKQYEQGVELIRYCFTLLRKVEQRVSILQSIGANGEIETSPFAAPSDSGNEPVPSPKRRRKAVEEADHQDGLMFGDEG